MHVLPYDPDGCSEVRMNNNDRWRDESSERYTRTMSFPEKIVVGATGIILLLALIRILGG